MLHGRLKGWQHCPWKVAAASRGRLVQATSMRECVRRHQPTWPRAARLAVRPVEACPSQQLDVAAIDARVHAVAVVFDLVQPAAARRRLV
jgi:hypothetical protein